MDQVNPILAADLWDIVRGLAPFAIMILYLIIQAAANAGKQKPGRAKPPEPGPQPQGQPDALADEVDAFLRRATGKQREPQVVEAESLDEPVVVAQVLKPADAKQPMGGVFVAEVASADVQMPSGQGVAAHVQHHIDSDAFDQRAHSLGEEVGLADEKLDDRLHATFDHQVGNLAGLPSATTGSELASAPVHLPTSEVGDDAYDQAITAADVSPISPTFEGIEDIRRAIILNEILRRPEDRW